MKFTTEKVTLKLLEEYSHLFLAHHLEVSYQPEMVLDPDPNQYVKAYENGILRWYGMRIPTGEVVGYFTFFVTQFLHHVKHKQAHQGLLFIRSDHRGPWFGDFLKYAQDQLKAEGVEKVFLHASPKNNLHKYFERMGLPLVDRGYELDLKDFVLFCSESEPALSKTGEY